MTDVIVAGGGTAGFAAAVAAARAGAKVLIVEQLTYLGGTMTGGLVPGLVSMRHQPWRDEETLVQLESLYAGNQVAKGLAQEFVDRLLAAGGAYGRKGEASVRVLFDPEISKWVIDQMVKEAGVEVRYCSKVVGVLKEGEAVCGVRVDNGVEIRAGVVIDTTGDGNVAVFAGATYEQGESGTPTLVQPASLYFMMGGVDMDKTLDYIASAEQDYTPEYRTKIKQLHLEAKPLTLIGFPSLRVKALQNGDYPIPYGTTAKQFQKHLCLARPIYRGGAVRYDITMHNVDMAYKVDATDVRQMSEAIIAMREFTHGLAAFFKKYVPGYENSYVLHISDMVGVRESRRIVGEYMLTGEDVIEARQFADSIGYCGGVVDIHNVDGGKEKVFMQEIKSGRAYQIPYRILIPRGIEGLLVAGRCISTDRVANGSIRQQAGCIVTGQAAGVGAAIAVKKKTPPRKIDTEELRMVLRGQGAIL
jgi:ribulose 1,5-bisphosphate synthetase/thiazole synthase